MYVQAGGGGLDGCQTAATSVSAHTLATQRWHTIDPGAYCWHVGSCT